MWLQLLQTIGRHWTGLELVDCWSHVSLWMCLVINGVSLTWLTLVLNFDTQNSMSNGVVLIKLGCN